MLGRLPVSSAFSPPSLPSADPGGLLVSGSALGPGERTVSKAEPRPPGGRQLPSWPSVLQLSGAGHPAAVVQPHPPLSSYGSPGQSSAHPHAPGGSVPSAPETVLGVESTPGCCAPCLGRGPSPAPRTPRLNRTLLGTACQEEKCLGLLCLAAGRQGQGQVWLSTPALQSSHTQAAVGVNKKFRNL